MTVAAFATAIGVGNGADAFERIQDAKSQQVFAAVCGKCY